MREDWIETTVEKLVNQKIIDKPLDGNHGEIHPKKSDFTESGIPFVMASDLVKGAVNQETCNFISREQANSLRKGFAKNGDVLLSHKGTIGRSAILQTSLDYVVLTPQVTYYRILNNSLLDNRFLYYSFHSPKFQNEIKKIAGSGSTRAYIGITQQLQLHIPITPLAEQKRIVAILDEAFEGIDRAIANTEKNLANSHELFESYLNTIFTHKGDGWKEKTLQEISIEFSRGKSKHRPRGDKKLYGGQYPLIQTGDISNSKHRITSYSQTYNELGLAQSKIWTKGTVCIAIVGANVAETAILDFDACFPDSVIGIIVNNEVADSDYVEYLLQYFKAELKEKGKGTARDNINIGTFTNHKFPFPDVKTQKNIACQLEELSFESQCLETIYRQKIAALNELKQSILQKAFTGKLTADTANQTTKAAQEVNAA